MAKNTNVVQELPLAGGTLEPLIQKESDLRTKREKVIMAVTAWCTAAYAGCAAAITATLHKDWKDAGGSWKKFFSFKNPSKLLEKSTANVISWAGIILGIGGTIMGWMNVKKATALEQSIKTTRRDIIDKAVAYGTANPKTAQSDERWKAQVAAEKAREAAPSTPTTGR